MPTQHPINAGLTDDDLDMLCDHLTNITLAYEDFNLDGLSEFCERVLPLDRFNELRALFGRIRDDHQVVCEILYGTPESRLDEIVASKLRHPAAGEHVEADQASPTGIPWYQYNKAVDRLTQQLQRGVITRDEYEAAAAALHIQAGFSPGAPAITEPGVPG